MSVTQLASRLRFIASQISTESQLLDRSDLSRPELIGLAVQLSYQARTLRETQDADLAEEWISIGINRLVEAILARTTYSDVPRPTPRKETP